MILFAISLQLLIDQGSAAESVFRPSIGASEIQWKEYGPCPPEKRGTNEIFSDFHLSKRHQGLTEVIGKLILLVPFDDNVTVNVDFSTLGSNLAWLPNVYTSQTPRACSSLINRKQYRFTEFLKSMGIVPKCPIAKGVYELKGYDVNKTLPSSLPITKFFLGRYRLTMEYLRFRKLVGCTQVIMQVVPERQRKPKNKNEH